MTQDSNQLETPTGKGADDENFPVGSFLLPKALRPHVAIYYDLARATDDIADFEIVHIAPDLDHAADELVADDHGDGDGLLRPVIPVVDMHISTANRGFANFNQ